MSIRNHPLVHTLLHLKGNARACVITEPLWGIPYFLFMPYASVYMLALGIKDAQIGLVTSIGMVSQIFFAILSGALADKLGRRKVAFMFDTLGWAIPCLLWAISQNVVYFIIAAVFNGAWRVGMTAWTCLLVEDTNPDLLLDVYSWIYISGLLAAFFAPLTGLFIHSFSLIPTMRGLYIFGMVFMTTKFIILYKISRETKLGIIRMQETRNQGLFSMLGEYKSVFHKVMRTPGTLYTIGILLVVTICLTITNTFWSVIVTEKIHIPAQYVALFPFARSVTMLFFFFLVMPRISEMHFKKPMLSGFVLYIVSQSILISLPEQNYVLLLLSTVLEACGYAALNPMLDKMLVVTVDANERARIMAIIYVIVIILTTPFGFIAGELSSINRNLPFVLNISIFIIGGFLTWFASRSSEKAALVEREAGF